MRLARLALDVRTFVMARRSPVYKAINKPLTIMGCDRRLFFSAVILGAALWNLFNTLLGGLVTIALSLFVARQITATDPQLPRIVLNSSKFPPEYDPFKADPRA